MAVVTCRVQYLEDTDPFVCTNFPEPRRPLQYELNENLLLNEQIAGVHKLLQAPLKVKYLLHSAVIFLQFIGRFLPSCRGVGSPLLYIHRVTK